MSDLGYLVDSYRRLLHLAARPNHILLTMTRKFVESCLHEILIFHDAGVDDTYTIDKLRTTAKKNPNINFPNQRDLEVQTVQMWGNLSVHHKHDPVNTRENWEIVYPALKNFTRWVFRDILSICEEFDEMEPMKITDFAQYGFNLEEGIFRIQNGQMNMEPHELKTFRDIVGLMYETAAPEMSQVMWKLCEIVLSAETIDYDLRKLILECMIITSWQHPFLGLIAFSGEENGSNNFSDFAKTLDSIKEQLGDMIVPTGEKTDSGLDPDEWA